MHPNFADWYRLVSIDPQQVSLDLRWKGVKALAQEVDKWAALDVVRQMFGKQPKAADFDATFRAPFKNLDSSFAMRSNNLEMEVLAGATVAHLLVDLDDTGVADAVALAIVCVDFDGLREKPNLSEIIEIAREHLHRRSNDSRTQFASPVIKSSKSKLLESVEAVAALTPTTGTITVASITPTLREIAKLPNALVKPVNDAFEKFSTQLRLQQEELNMLWWLFAEFSRDFRIRMSDVGHPAAIIVAAKELTDLTLTLPGPVAAEAFLDKMLQTVTGNREHKDTTVREAVAAPKLYEDGWAKRATAGESLESIDDLCTVHFALQRSAEAGGRDDDWTSAFEKRAGVKPDATLSPVALATQVYRERLLIRAMKEQAR